ncbi:hypothetical protein AC578_11112 [Pseudocercospora eumusae]|uniref:Uncharacterized protein n=1 Tax=Pseudocercospora eumusae TaxID=321146 RepID=A0A139HSJ4_9PEZI|nr:hypothetical protein AC578_11112 [Pseudocercospora eumusae]
MFCLRSWLPLLVFISSASPIYILCFLSAFYWLQRPCVYCSILLFVLVFSIFDFSADWFEPRWNGNATALTKTVASFLGGNSTFTEVALETASLAVSAINGTGGSLASFAMDNDGIGGRLGRDHNTTEWAKCIRMDTKYFGQTATAYTLPRSRRTDMKNRSFGMADNVATRDMTA